MQDQPGESLPEVVGFMGEALADQGFGADVFEVRLYWNGQMAGRGKQTRIWWNPSHIGRLGRERPRPDVQPVVDNVLPQLGG